jgi:tetratricopeptide (TPR) repeat protein
MKRLTIAVLGVGVVVCVALYANRPKAPAPVSAAPEALSETVSAQAGAEAAVVESPRPATEPVTTLSPLPVRSRSGSVPAASPSNEQLEKALLNQTVDTLVAAQATHSQKQEAWKQLREAGKLDQAITELEHRVADDPRSAECAAALGQAYLQKCGTIQDVREQGILAMQADKVFDTALTLDPANWEARFTKAMAMSYWPTNMNKGDEVIQHFQMLIQQQEAVTPQPQFAETYLWLGDQYQKFGHSNEARAVWQRGATLFPTHEKLLTRLASAQ